MKGLLIDTSHSTAMLGLSNEGRLIKTEFLPGSRGLSSSLFPLLHTFCDFKETSYISVGIGPGSYMGMRTGATVAKGLAYALNLPLTTFCSTLTLLPPGQEGSFAFIGDAKMGELYLVKGTVAAKRLPKAEKFHLLSPQQLDSHLENKDFIVGDRFLAPEPNLHWASILSFTLFTEKNFTDLHRVELDYLR